jgi:hypothetical protein
MKTKLILVHSGNKFPEYLNDCIELSLRQNLDIDLILSRNLHKYVKHDINIEVLENFQDEKFINFKHSYLPESFNDGFFNRTSNRFFIISNYAKSKQLKSFFHIENDVAMFSDLVSTKLFLEKTKKNICLVMDSDSRSVPSILWFRDHESATNLSDFIFANNNFTDMENLANYFNKNNDIACNFPVTPFDCFRSEIRLDNLFSDFNQIFDGCAIGQYLFGIDPIHHRQLNESSAGFINDISLFTPAKFKIFWEKKRPFLSFNNISIPIANLHMHCKNLKQLL